MTRYLDSENGEGAKLEAPTICVVILTYKRTEMALRTIRGVVDNLDYPKELRSWYIADDGSSRAHMDALWNCLVLNNENILGMHSEKFKPDTTFCGMGWNTALQKGHQAADIILWLEDDWELKTAFDIKPFVRLLLERQDVGIVRLGHLAVGSEVRVQGHNGIHYLEYLRSTPYAYSGNPLLRHRRMMDYYGLLATDRNPGDVELDYDSRFRADPNGPSIWRPADIPGWGVWGHIGQEKTW